MVFKKIIVKNGKIKSFELYPPFKNLYEGALIKWQLQTSQGVVEKRVCVSTSGLSDARWVQYYTTLLEYLNVLYEND